MGFPYIIWDDPSDPYVLRRNLERTLIAALIKGLGSIVLSCECVCVCVGVRVRVCALLTEIHAKCRVYPHVEASTASVGETAHPGLRVRMRQDGGDLLHYKEFRRTPEGRPQSPTRNTAPRIPQFRGGGGGGGT